MQDSYSNYQDPITLMRRMSEKNIPFSFSHKRLDGTTAIIRQATLRSQARTSKDKNAKYKLQYTNLETNELRSCFIPLITSFNGKPIYINK